MAYSPSRLCRTDTHTVSFTPAATSRRVLPDPSHETSTRDGRHPSPRARRLHRRDARETTRACASMPSRRKKLAGGGGRKPSVPSPSDSDVDPPSDEDVFEDVRDVDAFEDEEIDEDEAFDDEDEARWGEALGGGAESDEAWDDDDDVDGYEGVKRDGKDGDDDDLRAVMDSEEEQEEEPRTSGRDAGKALKRPRDDERDDGEEDLRDLLSEEEEEEEDARRERALDEIVGKRKKFELDPRYRPVVKPAGEENLFAIAARSDQPKLTLKDVMASLGEDTLSRETVKRLNKIAKAKAVDAPLARPIQERIDRRAAYAETSADVSKYQSVVKENREKRTLKFAPARDEMQRKDTLGALTADFLPKTEIEMEIAKVLKETGHASAKDVVRGELLEMNHLDTEDIKSRQAKLAKMRAVLFYHEQKAKRLKAIKSKAYHRVNRKGELKVIGDEDDGDADGQTPEERREYLRAQERMLLRHKNTSRWAKRAIKKGIAHLAGTREKLQEQLRIGQQLREKIEGTRTTTSDGEESTDAEDSDDDDAPDDPATERKRRLKAKAAALKALEDGGSDLAVANESLFKLPFMARAMEKRRTESQAEAREMLDELDRMDHEDEDGSSDSEDDSDDDEWEQMTARAKQAVALKKAREDEPSSATTKPPKSSNKNSNGPVIKAKPVGEISDAARKMRQKAAARVAPPRVVEEEDEEPTVMLDEERQVGMNNEDLMRRAFANDGIEAEFEKEKLADVNAELPDADTPKNLPGWGQWAGSQKTPKWMIEAEKKAKAERAKALKSRRDAKLKHVVISEKFDKKAAQFNVESLPHGFSSKATYEGTMRQPLGPDVNTSSMFAKLNAPKILKPTGSIIKPLKLPKQKQKTKKSRR